MANNKLVKFPDEDNLLRDIKILAVNRNTSANDLIVQACREFMNKITSVKIDVDKQADPVPENVAKTDSF